MANDASSAIINGTGAVFKVSSEQIIRRQMTDACQLNTSSMYSSSGE